MRWYRVRPYTHGLTQCAHAVPSGFTLGGARRSRHSHGWRGLSTLLVPPLRLHLLPQLNHAACHVGCLGRSVPLPVECLLAFAVASQARLEEIERGSTKWGDEMDRQYDR